MKITFDDDTQTDNPGEAIRALRSALFNIKMIASVGRDDLDADLLVAEQSLRRVVFALVGDGTSTDQRVKESPGLLNARNETDRLAIARGLYERFCDDLRQRPEWARARLVAGMQVVMRDAAEGVPTTLLEKSDRPTDLPPPGSRDVP